MPGGILAAADLCTSVNGRICVVRYLVFVKVFPYSKKGKNDNFWYISLYARGPLSMAYPLRVHFDSDFPLLFWSAEVA
jgi:hypothetical protein